MAPDDRMTNDAALDAIVAGTSDDPCAMLGRHHVVVDGRAALVFRTLQPAASEVQLVTDDRVYGMQRKRREGLFEAIVRLDARTPEDVAYRFHVREGTLTRDVIDPYQFGQVLSDVDLHLFAEGTQDRAWERFGAHRMTIGAATGVHFAAWAPKAQRASVIGDFNQWDGRTHVMRRLVPSSVWELFAPGLADGDGYEFEVRTHAGQLLNKADRYARRFEAPPKTASGWLHFLWHVRPPTSGCESRSPDADPSRHNISATSEQALLAAHTRPAISTVAPTWSTPLASNPRRARCTASTAARRGQRAGGYLWRS